jgi:hypothetical protein
VRLSDLSDSLVPTPYGSVWNGLDKLPLMTLAVSEGGRRIRCWRNNMSAKSHWQSPHTCQGLCGASLDFDRLAVSAVLDGGFLS